MLISKNLFRHSSNSRFHPYLLIITAVIMLLSMAGCNSCGGGTVETQYATDLHVTLTPLELYGSQREAVLTVSTKGAENVVARFKDFDIKLEVSATGSEGIGSSQIHFTGFIQKNNKWEENTRTIQLNNNKKYPIITGSLDKFFKGGAGASLEYKQEEKLKFHFKPDMQNSNVESMEIKITVMNNETHKPVFEDTSKWTRSSYELKVTGLDTNGVIQNNVPCTLRVARKDQKAITPEELDNLYIAVAKDQQGSDAPHLLGVEEGYMTFQAAELQGKEIVKQLIVVPGTIQEMVIFSLSLYENDEPEAAFIAKAKYHPVVLPYIFEVDKKELMGTNHTQFKVTVKDTAGKVLEPEQLKKLTLQVERKDGNRSIIQETNKFKFKVPVHQFQMEDADKSATQSFTIVPNKDTRSAFKLSLVNDQGVTVGSEQFVSWWVGVEAKIVYNPSKNQFEFNVSNKTADPVKITLEWENVTNGGGGSNGVEIAGQEKGSHDVPNLVAAAEQTDILAVNWGGLVGLGAKGEAKFRLTVKLTNAINILDPYEEFIHRVAPQVTIVAKSAKVAYQGEGEKAVTFVLTATAKDIDRADFNNLAISWEAENGIGVLRTPAVADVNGVSLDQLLDNSISKLIKNVGQEITLTIDNQNSHQVKFANIYLKGSHAAQDGKINEITWQKDPANIKITVTPVGGTVTSGDVLVVDSTKIFVLKLENTSGFPLDQALLQGITIQADAAINTKAPDQVLCQGLDMKAGPTLWDVFQKQPAKYQEFKPTEPIQLSFEIQSGDKKLVEFVIRLKDTTRNATLQEQQVRWGSLVGFVDESQDIKLNMDQAQVDAKDTKPKLSIPVKLKNISGQDIPIADLKNIKVVLIQTAKDLEQGNAFEYGKVTIGTMKKKGDTMRRQKQVKGTEVLNLISQFENDKGSLTSENNNLASLLEGAALSGGVFAKDAEVSLNLKVDISKCQETDKSLKSKGTVANRYVRFRLMGPGNTIMSEQRIEISPSVN